MRRSKRIRREAEDLRNRLAADPDDPLINLISFIADNREELYGDEDPNE